MREGARSPARVPMPMETQTSQALARSMGQCTIAMGDAFDDAWRVVILDDVHVYSAVQQQAAFNWFVNATTPNDGQQRWVLAAGDVPPSDLTLREDLRTRLGWGHIFQLQVLSEAERRAVLRQQADERGVFLLGFLEPGVLGGEFGFGGGAVEFAGQFAGGGFELLVPAAKVAAGPVELAEAVEDGALNAVLGVAGEADHLFGVVLGGGVEQAEDAGVHQIVDFDVHRKIFVNAHGDGLHQREMLQHHLVAAVAQGLQRLGQRSSCCPSRRG